MTKNELLAKRSCFSRALMLAVAALAGGCSANAQNANPGATKSSAAKPAAPVAQKVAAAPASPDAALPRAGINLNGPADWNSELPFVDVFRLSREWISQKEGAAWGQGPKLELDEHGWIKKLEPNTFAETPMSTVSRSPAGRYTVLYKGKGKLDVGGNAFKVEESPGRMIIESKGTESIFLRVLETDPTDYVRDIRVVMPGFEQTYQKQVFHPLFVERWRGMTVLRFMDWMNTNNSKQQKWADRPKMNSATWTRDGGIPIEVAIDLSNRLGADAWFCIPHLADENYVRQFATLVKQKLHPARRIYVEYSNEVWNGQFEQSRWAGQKGLGSKSEKSLGTPHGTTRRAARSKSSRFGTKFLAVAMRQLNAWCVCCQLRPETLTSRSKFSSLKTPTKVQTLWR
jgi:hypothetical protein